VQLIRQRQRGQAFCGGASGGQVRKDAGLTWYDVLGVRVIPRNGEINGKLEFLKQHPEFLTEWQSGFVISLDRFDMLSAAQLSALSETHAQAGIKQRREERQARKAATELDEALRERERLAEQD
jgi:hypothetical protein